MNQFKLITIRSLTISLTLLTINTMAMAASGDLDKINNLDIELEVEDLDIYDEEAQARETRAETKRLDRETHRLENEISYLKKKNKRIQSKTQRLHHRYIKSAAVAHRVTTKVRKLRGIITSYKIVSIKYRLKLTALSNKLLMAKMKR